MGGRRIVEEEGGYGRNGVVEPIAGMKFARLKTRAKNERVVVLFPNLVQLAGIGREGIVIMQVQRLRERERVQSDDLPGAVSKQDRRPAHVWPASLIERRDIRIGIEIGEKYFVREPTDQEKRVNPGSPLVAITSQKDRRLLQLAKMDTGREVPLIVILDQIALANVLVFRLEKDRVLRGELNFHLKVGFRTRDLVVRPAGRYRTDSPYRWSS